MSALNQEVWDSIHVRKVYSNVLLKKKKIQHESSHAIKKHWEKAERVHISAWSLTQSLAQIKQSSE